MEMLGKRENINYNLREKGGEPTVLRQQAAL